MRQNALITKQKMENGEIGENIEQTKKDQDKDKLKAQRSSDESDPNDQYITRFSPQEKEQRIQSILIKAIDQTLNYNQQNLNQNQIKKQQIGENLEQSNQQNDIQRTIEANNNKIIFGKQGQGKQVEFVFNKDQEKNQQIDLKPKGRSSILGNFQYPYNLSQDKDLHQDYTSYISFPSNNDSSTVPRTASQILSSVSSSSSSSYTNIQQNSSNQKAKQIEPSGKRKSIIVKRVVSQAKHDEDEDEEDFSVDDEENMFSSKPAKAAVLSTPLDILSNNRTTKDIIDDDEIELFNGPL